MPDDFYTPTDIDILRMENELLAFEVRFLRARLARASHAAGSSTMSADRLMRLEEAEKDLVLWVKRMGSGPLGTVFRLSKNFQTLEERYVRSRVSYDSLTAPERTAYLEGAERDLVLLLKRMGKGPLAPLFRRRRSFRTLEERYL